jgi:hypothetical protein
MTAYQWLEFWLHLGTFGGRVSAQVYAPVKFIVRVKSTFIEMVNKCRIKLNRKSKGLGNSRDLTTPYHLLSNP